MNRDVTMARQGMGLSETASTPPESSLWRRAWAGWKRIAHAIGVVQTRLIMFIFFFLFVLPLGLVLRLLRDPLHLKHPAQSNWVPHPQEPHTLDAARRQF